MKTVRLVKSGRPAPSNDRRVKSVRPAPPRMTARPVSKIASGTAVAAGVSGKMVMTAKSSVSAPNCPLS